MPNFNFLLKTAKKAIYEAGEAILEIYKGENFGIESKKDNSPVTIADKKAHEIIANKLSGSFGFPNPKVTCCEFAIRL